MGFIAQEIAKTRKQAQFLGLFANILSKSQFLNKRIRGCKLVVKGKIGRHGRTKTFIHVVGYTRQQVVSDRIVFYFNTTATFYGALGLRLWLIAA